MEGGKERKGRGRAMQVIKKERGEGRGDETIKEERKGE